MSLLPESLSFQTSGCRWFEFASARIYSMHSTFQNEAFEPQRCTASMLLAATPPQISGHVASFASQVNVVMCGPLFSHISGTRLFLPVACGIPRRLACLIGGSNE